MSAWPRVWRDSAPRELGPVVLGKGLRTEPRAISPGPSAVERSPSVGFLNLRTSSGVYMAAGPVFSSPSPLLARSHCPPGHQRSGLWKRGQRPSTPAGLQSTAPKFPKHFRGEDDVLVHECVRARYGRAQCGHRALQLPFFGYLTSGLKTSRSAIDLTR